MATNYQIGFWVVLALLGVGFIMIVVFVILAALQVANGKNAVLRLTGVSMNHNGATEMTVLLNLNYKANARKERMVDYERALTTINSVMSSGSFQDGESWDNVAEEIGSQFYNDYDLYGVSVQILLYENGSETELFGPTYSKGNVSRLQKFNAMN